ncbi:hypothetical protein [Halapricum hydrolyticum]|uniref:Uncharacterized protein n=1 Tax=Halapricum hydrolyticum TaxID=2979991 RepID=A0AAE3I8E6_9EURY|nr:hypothetical protein [Halapricum hydrolyticum]MCU4716854.1 hypothetical protein [Halapricum hydrolyticum]MCU4725541.1 hypothetical protein [Halapricum hydrolyticum]
MGTTPPTGVKTGLRAPSRPSACATRRRERVGSALDERVLLGAEVESHQRDQRLGELLADRV